MSLIVRFLPILFLLSACAFLAPTVKTDVPPQQWQVDGVMAYQDQGKGFSAGYIWKNEGAHYTIQVIGPLGMTRVTLSGDGAYAHLQTSDSTITQQGAPEVLMKNALGWSIPVSELLDWFWMKPNIHYDARIKHNAAGQVVEIQQSNWTVRYQDLQTFGSMTLPERIILTQGSRKITVVLQHVSSP